MLSEGVEIHIGLSLTNKLYKIGEICLIKGLYTGRLLFNKHNYQQHIENNIDYTIRISGLKCTDVDKKFIKEQYMLLEKHYEDTRKGIELKKQQENNEKILQILNKI